MVRWASLILLAACVVPCAARAEGVDHARLDRLDRVYDIHSDLTYVETTSVDYTVYTPRGLHEHDRSTKSFNPGAQTLEVLEAWVDQPDGSRVQVGPDSRFTRPSQSAQDAPGFSSGMTTTLLYPQLRPGSRTHVRWRLTQRSAPLLGFNAWAEPPLDSAVGSAQIELHVAPGVPLQWRARGFAATERADPQGGRTVVARLTGTQAEEPERDMVATADFQPLFLATTMPTAQTLGGIYWQLGLTKTQVTPDIAALAQRLAGGRTGEAAARLVYDWVARNIRYVAVYLDPNDSWVPHAAADVLRAGYGDCKDHVALMQALLGALGIRAQAALVDWGSRQNDPPLWLPNAFNHAIVYLPDYDRYLNPTDPYARYDSLEGLAGKTVVIASPEGRLARTPPARPQDNAFALDQSVILGADGSASGSARFRLSPNLETDVRAMVARASSPRDLAQRLLSGTPEGGFGEFRTSDPRDLGRDFDVVGTWRSPHAVAFQEGLAYLPVPVGLDLDPASRLRRYLSDGPRRHAVVVGAADDSWTTDIGLPPGVSVVRLPEDATIGNAAGSYTASYRRTDRGVRVERRLVVQQEVFQPAEIPALEELLYAAIDDSRAPLVLGRSHAEAAAGPAVPWSAEQ